MIEHMISVVIAAYNAEKFIATCIESVQKQTYDNWEMLICDDCSTDSTVKIIQRYQEKDSRIRLLRNLTNMRAAASRNRCIKEAKGKYIVIQDADDVCDKNRFRMLLERIKGESIDFVSSGHYLFDDRGIYKNCVPSIEYPQKKDFLFGLPFCHAATMFKRDALIAVNGYRVSKETRRGQDYDMFMRLYADGFKGCNIPDLLYGYRVDKNTIRRRKFEYRVDGCVIRYKGFKAMGLLPRGYIYVLKPIAAYLVQMMRRR